jgi:hypothetical protein
MVGNSIPQQILLRAEGEEGEASTKGMTTSYQTVGKALHNNSVTEESSGSHPRF